ncbi:MAG: FkbM family methyltransferase [Sulfurimicrobium sp.]|nr:FkbM family methyltransferase [Sulfurimicrobium sp.]MDP2198607.1 FkbM family methyltransferase [Sulfurimicrobium sp.]
MKAHWTHSLPPFLRWRAIYWAQHLRIMWLKHHNPAPDLAGVKLPIMHALSDNICAAIYDGYYEKGELSTFQSKLDKNDTVLEIGAGIGFLSSYCASQIGSENVFAYEANPQLEPLIRSVYSANGVQPTLKLGVLGEQAGQTTFYVTADFWASSLSRPSEPCKELIVPIHPLNEEIHRIHPTFLLMDIEGGEYDLIKIIDFHTIRKISAELHTDVLGQARIDEIRSIMNSAGFRIDDKLSHVIPGVREVLFLER